MYVSIVLNLTGAHCVDADVAALRASGNFAVMIAQHDRVLATTPATTAPEMERRRAGCRSTRTRFRGCPSIRAPTYAYRRGSDDEMLVGV